MRAHADTYVFVACRSAEKVPEIGPRRVWRVVFIVAVRNRIRKRDVERTPFATTSAPVIRISMYVEFIIQLYTCTNLIFVPPFLWPCDLQYCIIQGRAKRPPKWIVYNWTEFSLELVLERGEEVCMKMKFFYLISCVFMHTPSILLYWNAEGWW